MRLEELPPVNGVRHRTVSVNGLDMHVAEAGEGPPLLLVHGWPQHWWSWRYVIPALSQRYRVIVPDLRGMGWTEAPDGPYDKQTFADDLLALLDHEGIERTKILAHDWGGYASFLLALQHPERVERMVCLDIPPPWRTPFHPGQLLLPFALLYQLPIVMPFLGRWLMRSRTFVPRLIRFGSGPEKRWTDPDIAAFADVLAEPARAKASVRIYRDFQRRDLPAQMRRRPGQLRVPALLIMGGASVFHRIMGDTGLPVSIVEGSGHFLAEEKPEAVLALAEPFLEGA